MDHLIGETVGAKNLSTKEGEISMNDTQRSYESNSGNGRNYELDFLKLVFAMLIFFYHMRIFFVKNDPVRIAINHFGTYCVHFFFIVSGMLMANSISKQNITENFGKASIDFVMRKFKGLFGKIILSLCFVLIVDTLIYISNGIKKGISGIGQMLVETVPELLMIKMGGVYIENNLLTWYISAMLLCMLPLAYMLYKNKDFTLYVFAPLAAVFLLGYICQTDAKFAFFNLSGVYGFFLGGIYRALCGLCFGLCAYTIRNKIKRIDFNKRKRIILTISEVLLYVLYFYVICFSGWGNKSYMCVSLLLPIALAITFSGKSYVGSLFRFKWMRCFAPLSLLIYLNHIAPRTFVSYYFKGKEYLFCTAVAAAITAVFCILSWVILRLCKALWIRKIKPALDKPDS